MDYNSFLSSVKELTISTIIKHCKEQLPLSLSSKPWSILGHGVGLLETEDQLNAYIASYGEMHEAKCKKALINFQSIDISAFNYEIIDWGCGQGLGTLCVLEKLRNLDREHYVRKVTLIEPSSAALHRAKCNVEHVVKYHHNTTSVIAINDFLPSSLRSTQTDSLTFNAPVTIHIFSNILDITTVDIRKLSSLVSSSGNQHVVLCMGPMNANARRIDDFCNYFSPVSYFSDTELVYAGHTTDTLYPYSCKTKCFAFTREGFVWNRNSVVEGNYKPEGNYSDYDDEMWQENGYTRSVRNIYRNLGQTLSQDEQIILRPKIHLDNPDLILISPNSGFLVVLSSSLSYDDLREEHKVETLLSRLQGYKDNLLKLHLTIRDSKCIAAWEYQRLVKPVAIFSSISQDNIDRWLESLKQEINVTEDKEEKSHKEIIYNTCKKCFIGYDASGREIRQQVGFYYKEQYMSYSLASELKNIIASRWHSFKDGENSFNLTPIQKNLSKAYDSFRKIAGVAGSGKTEVLVRRALNANISTGHPVLILTFNIALVNYLKHRLSLLQADFCWADFDILNYHQFFKAQAYNYGKRPYALSYNDPAFFDDVNVTNKYKTILIDECQDYLPQWISLLRKNFLAEKGVMVFFGDLKQNIYSHCITEDKKIVIPGDPSNWTKQLLKGFRFTNRKMTDLVTKFQLQFFPDLENDAIEFEQSLDFDGQKLAGIWNANNPDEIAGNCNWIIQQHNVEMKDVVILGQCCNVLRDIDFVFGHRAVTTFEDKETYDALKDKFMDEPAKLKRAIDDVRRNKKLHFTMQSPYVKISTIHSFKGWESHTVILILQPEEDGSNHPYAIREEENSAELIYTAMTRAKNNLFVLNMGNKRFSNFFIQNIVQ